MCPLAAKEAKVDGEGTNDEDAEAEAKWCEEFVPAHGPSYFNGNTPVPRW
jgi:hypothetical protein